MTSLITNLNCSYIAQVEGCEIRGDQLVLWLVTAFISFEYTLQFHRVASAMLVTQVRFLKNAAEVDWNDCPGDSLPFLRGRGLWCLSSQRLDPVRACYY